MVRSRSFDSSSQCFRNLGRDLGVASPQTPLNMISLPLGDSTDAQMPIPDPSRPTMQWKGGFATVAQSNRLYGRLLNFTHFQRNCWLVRKQRDTQPETAAFSLKMLILEAFCRFAHSRWLVTRLSSFRFIFFCSKSKKRELNFEEQMMVTPIIVTITMKMISGKVKVNLAIENEQSAS